MTQYLLETLLWTGALIALVLLLRRPVARHFGARAAYALWALPLLRLAVPPITLPAWLRPGETAPPLAEMAEASDPASLLTSASLAQADAIAPVFPLPATAAPLPPIDWLTPLLILWLAGAAIFLIRRFALYFAMRRELLDGAKPVGEVGRVRLVETGATLGPVAFGVFDKVVALPTGFMVQRDRSRRDLAIAHELAHHRGHDLLANILVQPLFAAHWFSPLGWAGWTALRRDQEAACDARVVETRSRDERAAYAAIIAGFALTPGAAPRLALAAPMACPVLGDKSIIHRLRSLTMADISPRRRLAARALLAGAALALPLTASISYAETIAPPAPAAPAAPEAPAAPSAPVAPLPPATPLAPEPPDFDAELVEAENAVRESEREFEKAEREMDRTERKIRSFERAVESGDTRRIAQHRIEWNGKEWSGMSATEREDFMKEAKELRARLAEGGELRLEMEQLRREMGANGEIQREIRTAFAEARNARATALAQAPRVVMECRDKENYITTEQHANGQVTMYVCEANAEKLALNALRTARSTIASERNLTRAQRAEALRSIDQEIADVGD